MDYFQQRLFQLENDKTNVNLKENEKYSNGYSFRGAIPRDKSEHQQQTLHSKNELELLLNNHRSVEYRVHTHESSLANSVVQLLNTLKNLAFRSSSSSSPC